MLSHLTKFLLVIVWLNVSKNRGENLDEFLQALKILSEDCNFKDVTAAGTAGRGNPRCLYQWLTIITYSSAFT